MPLFEYECRDCGHRFESLVLGRTQERPSCPSCDSREVEKQFSAFGVGSSSGGGRGAAPVRFSGG